MKKFFRLIIIILYFEENYICLFAMKVVQFNTYSKYIYISISSFISIVMVRRDVYIVVKTD